MVRLISKAIVAFSTFLKLALQTLRKMTHVQTERIFSLKISGLLKNVGIKGTTDMFILIDSNFPVNSDW